MPLEVQGQADLILKLSLMVNWKSEGWIVTTFLDSKNCHWKTLFQYIKQGLLDLFLATLLHGKMGCKQHVGTHAWKYYFSILIKTNTEAL